MWVVLWIVAGLLPVQAISAAIPASLPADQGSGVSASAEYKIERCAYCEAEARPSENWCEKRANGKWQCRGCKAVRYFRFFLYPPVGYTLLPWAERYLQTLYGTMDMQTGRRQYRRSYLSEAKQNGKSFLTGGLPIYHLDCEDEQDPEVYGAASAKDQAGLVFKATAKLIRANPHLVSKFKILDTAKKISWRDRHAGSYEVISADGDVRDGTRGSLLIRDEIHRWKSQKAETLRDVLTKGQISRAEPLDIQATTAGAEYESPMWFAEYQFAKLVLAEPSLAPDYYPLIFEADAKRVEEEPGYWESKEARLAANPSHEDFGGHLTDVAIVAELNKARANAAERSKYLRYHLNVPIKTHEDPVIDVPKWQACGGGVDLRDLRTWPHYDEQRLIETWDLAGQRCYGGVDASWTIDFTAVVYVFPPNKTSAGAWTLLPHFWIPKENVAKIERICRVPIQSWIDQGFIHATDGNSIDLRSVKEEIRRGRKRFNLVEVPYDRANFRVEGIELAGEGIRAVEVPQNFMELGAPTKFLLGAYPDKRIRHGNNPVLNWMAASLQLQYDHKDNCQPSKPERGKTSKRIDGMQATITALNRALAAQPQATYTGLRSVAC